MMVALVDRNVHCVPLTALSFYLVLPDAQFGS